MSIKRSLIRSVKQMKTFMKQVLSEEGVPSCKRVCAVIAYCSTVLVMWYMEFKGDAKSVETIAQTLIISASALLGVYNITGIFKNK